MRLCLLSIPILLYCGAFVINFPKFFKLWSHCAKYNCYSKYPETTIKSDMLQLAHPSHQLISLCLVHIIIILGRMPVNHSIDQMTFFNIIYLYNPWTYWHINLKSRYAINIHFINTWYSVYDITQNNHCSHHHSQIIDFVLRFYNDCKSSQNMRPGLTLYELLNSRSKSKWLWGFFGTTSNSN